MKLFVPMAALLAILSCGRRSSFRIGCVTPLTGEAATLGQSTRMGHQLAVEEWNARGGVLGRPIHAIIEDDQGDPAEGAAVFARLAGKVKVAAIIGSSFSHVALAAAPTAQDLGVPTVTATATHLRVTQVGDYIFRACFSDDLQGGAAAKFAFADLKARSAASLFDEGNAYAVGLAESFRARFTALGGRLVAHQGHPSGASTFKAHLARMLQGRPDLLYVPDYYPDAALVVRQARELGFRGPVLGGDGWDSPHLLKIGGKSLENCFHTAHGSWMDPDPAVQAFVRAFQAKFRVDPDGNAIMAYDATNLVLEAIRRASTLDGAAVRAALARSDLRGISGRIRFDVHRNPAKAVTVIQVKEGRQVFRTKVV